MGDRCPARSRMTVRGALPRRAGNSARSLAPGIASHRFIRLLSCCSSSFLISKVPLPSQPRPFEGVVHVEEVRDLVDPLTPPSSPPVPWSYQRPRPTTFSSHSPWVPSFRNPALLSAMIGPSPVHRDPAGFVG